MLPFTLTNSFPVRFPFPSKVKRPTAAKSPTPTIVPWHEDRSCRSVLHLSNLPCPVPASWVLLAAAVFLGGFRIGLNAQASNVIDVGYSGVIGAERIAHGQAPWGNFPIEQTPPQGPKRVVTTLKACGLPDTAGEIRERIQTNGRCESANPQGTRTAPSRMSPTSRVSPLRVGRQVGLSPLRISRRSRSTSSACSGSGSSAPLRRSAAGRRAHVRVGCLSIHAVRVELEHE